MLNVFYLMLGAKISPYARIDTFFREWDLVTIGDLTQVDGLLFPRVFRGKRVHLGEIVIGDRTFLGSGAVIQLGSNIGSDTIIEPKTLVPERSTLEANTRWNGTPCTQLNESTNESVVTRVTRVLSILCIIGRLVIVPVFAVVLLSTYYGVNTFIPAAPSHFATQVWTIEGFLYIGAFMLTYQLTGVFLLLGLVLLKWSFLAPYATDRFGDFIVFLFFPTVDRNTLSSWYLALFGLKRGRNSYILLNPDAVPLSKAHLVEIGDDAFLASVAFAPENDPCVANSVWSWIGSKGALLSPWSYNVDIKIPTSFQGGLRTRFESGICIEHGAFGTSPSSRVRQGSFIKASEMAIGAPTGVRLQIPPSTSFRQLQTCMKLFGLVSELLFLVVLAVSILIAVQVIRSMPVYGAGVSFEARIMLVLLVGVMIALAIVLIVLVGYKWVFIGRARKEDVTLDSVANAQMLFLQNATGILDYNFNVLFAGLMPVNLYHKMMGHKLDLTTVFINEHCWIDPNDDVTIHPWAVVDTMAVCNGHTVDRNGAHKEPVIIYENAILHPVSTHVLGSLGHYSELFPLSKSLAKVHIPENQVYIGNPAQQYIVLSGSQVARKVKVVVERPQDI